MAISISSNRPEKLWSLTGRFVLDIQRLIPAAAPLSNDRKGQALPESGVV
jgi:hypothetical protein